MALQKAIDLSIYVIFVELKGFSLARDDVQQQIASMHSSNPSVDKKLFIQTLRDKTPRKFGGTRARKARRL